MLLGAHLSTAGGIHRALELAAGYGFQTVGVFVRNQLQWHVPPLDKRAVAEFRLTRRRLGIRPVVAHGSYLVNLAGAGEVRRKSIAAVAADLDRCGRLGIEYLNIHPGSCPAADVGIARVAEALDDIVAACPHSRPEVLLETTAGQGSSIGHAFEQIAAILATLDRPRRVGVCLDTCHVFAAGYDIRSPEAYRQTMDQFDRIIGLDRLKAIHLNDSVREIGSRVDRHAHIGFGRIGSAGFKNFVDDDRLADVPMILETPKGKDARGRDWDRINAETIRRLAARDCGSAVRSRSKEAANETNEGE